MADEGGAGAGPKWFVDTYTSDPSAVAVATAGFLAVPRALLRHWRDLGLSRAELSQVLCYLCEATDPYGERDSRGRLVPPSDGELAEMLDVSRRTVVENWASMSRKRMVLPGTKVLRRVVYDLGPLLTTLAARCEVRSTDPTTDIGSGKHTSHFADVVRSQDPTTGNASENEASHVEAEVGSTDPTSCAGESAKWEAGLSLGSDVVGSEDLTSSGDSLTAATVSDPPKTPIGKTEESSSTSEPAPRRRKRELPDAAEWAMRLAEGLDKRLGQINPKRVPTKEADIRRWASDIEKLQRIDGRDPDEIRCVIRWAMKHHFWQKVVQSGANFRAKWNRITAEMQSESTEKTTSGDHSTFDPKAASDDIRRREALAAAKRRERAAALAAQPSAFH